MIYYPNDNSTQELIRVFNLISKDIAWIKDSTGITNLPSQIPSSRISGGGPGGSNGANGLNGVNGRDGRDGRDGRNGRDGDTGPTGPTGESNLAIVGIRQELEFLVGPDGYLLTDENGYALMGISCSNEVLCGVEGENIAPLGV